MLSANVPNIIPVGTVMDATINSEPIPLYQTWGYAIQIFFTGTPTGSFELEASCDYVPQARVAVQPPTNWTIIANTNFSVSAAGSLLWNVTDICYNYVRVVYTDSSGGTSTAVISSALCNTKGF